MVKDTDIAYLTLLIKKAGVIYQEPRLHVSVYALSAASIEDMGLPKVFGYRSFHGGIASMVTDELRDDLRMLEFNGIIKRRHDETLVKANKRPHTTIRLTERGEEFCSTGIWPPLKDVVDVDEVTGHLMSVDRDPRLNAICARSVLNASRDCAKVDSPYCPLDILPHADAVGKVAAVLADYEHVSVGDLRRQYGKKWFERWSKEYEERDKEIEKQIKDERRGSIRVKIRRFFGMEV